MKSLGELGYERFQARWVDFLIDEAVINGQLPNLNGQCLMHWVMAVKDDGEREILYRKANGLPIDQDNTHYGADSESEGEDDENDVETDDFDLLTDSDKKKLLESDKEHKVDKQVKQTTEIHTVDQCKDKVDSVKMVQLSKPQMIKHDDDHLNDQSKLSEASALSNQSNMVGTAESSSSLGAKPKTASQYRQQVRHKAYFCLFVYLFLCPFQQYFSYVER